MSRLVQLWREDLSAVNVKAAQALADPMEYANLFPDLPAALQVEELLRPLRSLDRLPPSTNYPAFVEGLSRNLIEEVKTHGRLLVEGISLEDLAKMKTQAAAQVLPDALAGRLLSYDLSLTLPGTSARAEACGAAAAQLSAAGTETARTAGASTAARTASGSGSGSASGIPSRPAKATARRRSAVVARTLARAVARRQPAASAEATAISHPAASVPRVSASSASVCRSGRSAEPRLPRRFSACREAGLARCCPCGRIGRLRFACCVSGEATDCLCRTHYSARSGSLCCFHSRRHADRSGFLLGEPSGHHHDANLLSRFGSAVGSGKAVSTAPGQSSGLWG